ncbi:MAG: hypothetical protein JNL08_13610 [Planctomycetes bacterium]|nr:hypothetical protein [Planctomycetota bacterium]
MTLATACWVGQLLCTLPLDGRPVRLGLPVPAAVVTRGLRASGGATLQWRRLPIGGAAPDPVWVELAVVGHGRVAITAGGAGPHDSGSGPACVREALREESPHGPITVTRWRWCNGVVDERRRLQCTVPLSLDGEAFAVAEAVTTDGFDAVARAAVWCRLPRSLQSATGVLPPAGRLGEPLRRELLAALPALRELPGRRGAGDYARSGGIVTNLEFDTTLAMLRCALASRDEAVLARALRSARHLLDHDLDPRSGLPFAHGPDHRSGSPEPGHCWLQGLLWLGCLAADDDLLAAARSLGGALAARPPTGSGRDERARDFAWPLLELEALLALEPTPELAAAADRLALAIAARHDPVAQTFRFGEGELGRGLYLERAWVTGGIVLPALRAHLRRRPDRRLAELVRGVEAALVRAITAAPQGVPLLWRTAGGESFGVVQACADARAVMLLAGLAPAELARFARRDGIAERLAGTIVPDDPDLATTWTMVARCEWVWR